MKSLNMLLALAIVLCIANLIFSGKITIKNNNVYPLKTEIDDEGNQIVHLPLFSNQSVDLVLDTQYPSILLPGNGFIPNFECKESSGCKSKNSDSKDIKYDHFTTKGQEIFFVPQLQFTKVPKNVREEQALPALLIENSDKWKMGQRGVLGMQDPISLLKTFRSIYSSGDQFSYEFYYETSSSWSYQLPKIDSFELNLNNADSRSTNFAPLSSDNTFKVKIFFNRTEKRQKSADYPFENIEINSSATFDNKNKTKALISFPGADEVAKKIYYSLCRSPNPCPRMSSSVYDAPDIYIILENGENQKNVIRMDRLHLFEEVDLNYVLRIKEANRVIFGPRFFSKMTGNSLIYKVEKVNGEDKYFAGFGTSRGKVRSIEDGIEWWIPILTVFGVLGIVILGLGAGFFILAKKRNSQLNEKMIN